MKLDVLPVADPWFADGLTFTCSQCGNCCTGPPGYVFISSAEIQRLADHLKATPAEVIDKYCRKVGSRYSLKEKRGTGGWDCIFLEEIESTRRPPGADRDIKYTKRICTIYPVRPLQCRTWPFWDGNLGSQKAWDAAAERCPGMNSGSRHFTRQQIEALRDAKDWPQNPPTSKS
jgi:Fe-S-cluster containining protein